MIASQRLLAHHLVWPILLLLAATASFAKDARVGDAPVVLTAPLDYCALQESEAADRLLMNRLRKVIAGENQLLASYADCGQLVALRQDDKPLNNFANYMTPLVTDKFNLSAKDIANFCSFSREKYGQIAEKPTPRLQSLFAKTIEGLSLNEVRFLGVLDEEASTCYVAFVQKLTINQEIDKTLICVGAGTLINGKFVNYYLYAPYTGAGSIAPLLAQHKKNVAILHAANR